MNNTNTKQLYKAILYCILCSKLNSIASKLQVMVYNVFSNNEVSRLTFTKVQIRQQKCTFYPQSSIVSSTKYIN